MPAFNKNSRLISFAFFIHNTDHQTRLFPDIRSISLGLQALGIGAWLTFYLLIVGRLDLNPEAEIIPAVGLLLTFAMTWLCRSLTPLFICSIANLVFLCFGARELIAYTDDPAFWTLPFCILITLAHAPLFNGIVDYLIRSAIVWTIIGYGRFPSHLGLLDENWTVMTAGASLIVGLFLNISFLALQLKNYRAEKELALMAYKDVLTGLNNRRMFIKRARELQQLPAATPLYFLMIDIDDFKEINDTLGHEVGDAVLTSTAHTIAEVSGEQLCGRLGGEEFGVIFQGDEAAACRFADRLLIEVNRQDASAGQVSVSIGLARLLKDRDLADSYRRADASLYLAKQGGKNRYALASC